MIKLSPQQLAVLASADGNGCAIRPATLKPAAAATIADKLIEQKLVREIRAKNDTPVWREDGQGRAYSLKVLKAGRDAVQGAARDQAQRDVGLYAGTEGVTSGQGTAAAPTKSSASIVCMDTGRAGTKRSAILVLLGRESGATIDELIAATGWLPHTTRAALTGLRKQGFSLERYKQAGEASIYKLQAAAAAHAA